MVKKTRLRINLKRRPKAKIKVKDYPPKLMGQIRTKAYYYAKERDFASGQELNDWLQAEQEILRK